MPKPTFLPVTTLALVLWLSQGIASGQTRPLRTEAATTAARGTLVFESGFDVIADEPSDVTGVPRTRWDGPLLRLVASPADNVELDLEWVSRVGVWSETGRGDLAASDWGDVTLRAKWRVHDGHDAGPTLGARFGVTLPETSFNDGQLRPLGLGPNTLRTFAEALFTQPLGEVRLHLNAGLLLHDEVYRPHEQRDFLSYGLALEWPQQARLVAVAEVQGRAGKGATGAEPRSEARAGLRLAHGRFRGDVALRRGLAMADGRWGVTAGVAWTIH